MRTREKLRVLRGDPQLHFDGRAEVTGEHLPTAMSIPRELTDETVAASLKTVASKYRAAVEREALAQRVREGIETLGKKATSNDPVLVEVGEYRRTWVIACSVQPNGIHIQLASESCIGGS